MYQLEMPSTPVKRRPSESGRAGPASVLVRKIGEGSFYKIYLTVQGTVLRIAKRATAGTSEASILESLDSPYTNRMLRWWCEAGVMHFEMEYCAGGALSTLLEERMAAAGTFDAARDHELASRRADRGCDGCAGAGAGPENGSISGAADERPEAQSNVLVDPFNDLETDPEPNTSYICTDESESSDAPFAPSRIEHPRWVGRLMFQVATGLAYIHSKNIIHMDIKPANILADGMDYRICDFNISRVGGGTVDLDGDCIYMAPEILKNRCYLSSDVFSLGIIYLQLCNPGTPPPGCGDAYRRIRRNDFGGWRLDEIGRAMLERNPGRRCTALSVSRYFGEYA